MGTRGAWGFKCDGEYKVTYNHFDSYPEGLGKTVAEFVANHTIDELQEVAHNIEMVQSDKKPTPEQEQRLQKWEKETGISVSDTSVGGEEANGTWYQLLRKSQGVPELYTKGLPFMTDDIEFLYDSIWCEYAYIIDIDDMVLRFYTGFNKNPNAQGDFAAKQVNLNSDYYGVAERGSWGLATDPATILNQMLYLTRIDELPSKWFIYLNGEVHEITGYNDWTGEKAPFAITLDDGTEWYIFSDSISAGRAARAKWKEMADEDPQEFAAIVGEETLVAWALGKYAGPGSTQVTSFEEWLDLWLDLPEEEWAGYDGREVDAQISRSFQEETGLPNKVVAYRSN